MYRQGTMRSCSAYWDDFWFCMRTRAYAAPQREAAVRAHYRAKEWRRYRAPGQPSSADVWEPRLRRVVDDPDEREGGGEGGEGGGGHQPFRTPYPEDLVGVSDEEWYVMEIERRRSVQEALRAQEAAREGAARQA